ncbi:MAG: hypothetical protein COA38_20005 [Fluviicola sp.]|nr:MAG: hypothetical protein COA38_20005 [Fluviicola sp.]
MFNDKQQIVFMFSGQGSHYRGMGRKLFENNEVFKRSLKESDELVRKMLNRSLLSELYDNSESSFSDILITHPAIVAVELALFEVLKEIGITPDYVTGNSLGEYSAAVVAGVLCKETAIELAIEQAKSIVNSVEHGGMLVILNTPKKELEFLYKEHGLFLAADNFEHNYTLSGALANLNNFENELKTRKISFQRLDVAFPFHSPIIERGKNQFLYYLLSFTSESNKPSVPFISGFKSKELDVIPEDYFWKVVSEYANFSEMVNYMENNGNYLYVDLGPSGASGTCVKYNLNPTSTSETIQIMTPFMQELNQLEKLKNLFEVNR